MAQEYNPNSKEALEKIRRRNLRNSLLEQKRKLESGLPHLYGFKWYKWAKEFFESRNRINLLCAANQISKSSTQIRKCIEWAGNEELWPTTFRRRPLQFWYLYPTQDMVNVEFKTKWIPEFLPREEYKEHFSYGWKEIKEAKDTIGISFNSGVTVYFKTYSQSASALQGATVDAIFCFATGTLVHVENGLNAIEKIRVGDRVHTRNGLKRVVRVFSHDALVMRRMFSNGEYIDATPDHKFFVQGKGYVEFKDLTSLESLVECDTWENWARQKRQYTRNMYILGTQKVPTKDSIIFKTTQKLRHVFYTGLFGKTTSEKSQEDTLSIILMKIQAITKLLTWSAYLKLYTLKSIKNRSGIWGVWVELLKRNASFAGYFLSLKLHKKPRQNGAQKNAGEKEPEQKRTAWFAVKNLLKAETINKTYALDGAAILGVKKVHCIEVEDEHNFFVNNINVKNCDEELPTDIFDELTARLTATDGYFHMVFTATIGQDFWECAMEQIGTSNETLKQAWKKTVSMYDCMVYTDGTPSPWTLERIRQREAMCKNELEVKRRIHGRFVVDEGRKYQGFMVEKNMIPAHKIPSSWMHFAGIDCGSGGEKHPAAIVIIAVSEDYKQGRVVKAWRGDNEPTTAGDVYDRFKFIAAGLSFTSIRVDPAGQGQDLLQIADREGDYSFSIAKKSHEIGTGTLNTLFKAKMLYLFDGDEEIDKLRAELLTVKEEGSKRHKKDDLADALRYGVASIPWDYSDASFDGEEKPKKKVKEEMTPAQWLMAARRGEIPPDQDINDISAEFDEWNEYYG